MGRTNARIDLQNEIDPVRKARTMRRADRWRRVMSDSSSRSRRELVEVNIANSRFGWYRLTSSAAGCRQRRSLRSPSFGSHVRSPMSCTPATSSGHEAVNLGGNDQAR